MPYGYHIGQTLTQTYDCVCSGVSVETCSVYKVCIFQYQFKVHNWTFPSLKESTKIWIQRSFNRHLSNIRNTFFEYISIFLNDANTLFTFIQPVSSSKALKYLFCVHQPIVCCISTIASFPPTRRLLAVLIVLIPHGEAVLQRIAMAGSSH